MISIANSSTQVTLYLSIWAMVLMFVSSPFIGWYNYVKSRAEKDGLKMADRS